MIKQERRFPLAEVHTTIGTMGEVRLDESFMSVLGVKPGESISFFIDAEGDVTVKGGTFPQAGSPQSVTPGIPKRGEMTQASLFGSDVSAPLNAKRRARKR